MLTLESSHVQDIQTALSRAMSNLHMCKQALELMLDFKFIKFT